MATTKTTTGAPSTQTKMTKLLIEWADELGLELVVDYAFPNMGTYRLQKVGGLATIWYLDFNFQPGYLELKRDSKSVYYADANNLGQTLDQVKKEMRVARDTRPRPEGGK